jgi:hypothetical protein
MLKRKRLTWVLPLAVLSTCVLGQSSSGIGTGTGSATSGASTAIRGPGLATVPNNSLAPLPGSVTGTTTPGLNPATPGLGTTTPGLSTTTPGLGTTTPGVVPSAPTPGLATTPGVVIEFPPPSIAPGTPAPSADAVRTCPPGITFC